MRTKDFKNKLIAMFIMFMAFVIGMNAQNKNCSPRTCVQFQNPDLLQIFEAIKEDSVNGSGGGGSCKTCYNQQTQDSINKSLLQVTITPSYTYIKGGSGTIRAGARYISIYNNGTNSATINDNILPPGITIYFPPVWNTVFSQMIYNAPSTSLLIIQIR
jgi:hypothetical protein